MTKKLYLLIAALTVIFLADFISYPFLQNLEYKTANKGANGIWLTNRKTNAAVLQMCKIMLEIL